MKISLANYRLHPVLCPIDMRRGFQSPERFGRHGSVGQCLGRARLCDLRVQKSPSVYGDLVR